MMMMMMMMMMMLLLLLLLLLSRWRCRTAYYFSSICTFFGSHKKATPKKQLVSHSFSRSFDHHHHTRQKCSALLSVWAHASPASTAANSLHRRVHRSACFLLTFSSLKTTSGFRWTATPEWWESPTTRRNRSANLCTSSSRMMAKLWKRYVGTRTRGLQQI